MEAKIKIFETLGNARNIRRKRAFDRLALHKSYTTSRFLCGQFGLEGATSFFHSCRARIFKIIKQTWSAASDQICKGAAHAIHAQLAVSNTGSALFRCRAMRNQPSKLRLAPNQSIMFLAQQYKEQILIPVQMALFCLAELFQPQPSQPWTRCCASDYY